MTECTNFAEISLFTYSSTLNLLVIFRYYSNITLWFSNNEINYHLSILIRSKIKVHKIDHSNEFISIHLEFI